MVNRVKELEARGYTFEAADASFELLLRDEMAGERQRHFQVESWRVIVEQRAGGEVASEATVKLHAKGERIVATGEGNGPVNSLDKALRLALERLYPELAMLELADYKVRILEGSHGTGAVTRVLIESSDGTGSAGGSWSTVGVDENIIAASWHALEEAVTYALLRAGHQPAARRVIPVTRPVRARAGSGVRTPREAVPARPVTRTLLAGMVRALASVLTAELQTPARRQTEATRPLLASRCRTLGRGAPPGELRCARAAVVVYFALLGVTEGMWIVRIPAVKAGLHLTDGLLGASLLVGPAGLVAVMPLAGRLSDQFGSVRLSRPAAAAVAVMPLFLWTASTLAGVMLAVLAFGVAGGMLSVALNAQGVKVEQAYERPLMASFHACFSVGGLAGALLGGLLAWHQAGRSGTCRWTSWRASSWAG